jgi:thiol-disulfide isomerase/thioredoxin
MHRLNVLAVVLLMTIHSYAGYGLINKSAPVGSIATSEGILELSGRTVVIDFWGTSCGPCIAALPAVAQFARETPSVPIVAITGDTQSQMENWIHGHQDLNLNGLRMVADRKLVSVFQVRTIPHMIVIENGTITHSHIGYGGSDELLSWLRKVAKPLQKIQPARPAASRPVLSSMPTVDDPLIAKAMTSALVVPMRESLIQRAYQDGLGPVFGARANDMGHRIEKVSRLFDSEGWRFPFKKTAGIESIGTTETFWVPPVVNGQVDPVLVSMGPLNIHSSKHMPDNDKHFTWVFPSGTVFFEKLNLPDGTCFEVAAMRKDGSIWQFDRFRPFPESKDLAETIQRERSEWLEFPGIKKLVDHCSQKNTLRYVVKRTEPFEMLVDHFTGYLDELPSLSDEEMSLVSELIKTTVFRSSTDKAWKSDEEKIAYAAQGVIAPKDYTGGLFEVRNESCMRCHGHAGEPIDNVDTEAIAYGNIWGNDSVFWWNPFDANQKFRVNEPRIPELSKWMLKTGLIRQVKTQ